MKQILRPELQSATKLTPLELNGIHFAGDGAVISPADLKKAAAKSPKGA